MLRPMNRLSRLLVSGGCIAASSLFTLAAGAMPPSPPVGVPPAQIPAGPAGADAPASPSAESGSTAASDKAVGPLPALPSSAPQAAPAAAPTDPAGYDASADTDPSALTDFRETLTPYGSWEDDATYGVVWVPSASVVGDNFTPYVSDGHWALAEDGNWMWVSDFNWGWAPFHYGRWLWIAGRGWGWIPGRVYSHAWVVWRTGYYDDYYVGWAPMPPTWYWRSGYAYGLYYVPPAPYVFCSSRYVFYPHVHSYIVPASRVSVIAPRTQPYVSAAATVGPTTYQSAALTRGPTMGDAHVPAGNVPTQRVAPDRHLSYVRPTAPSGERSLSRSVHTTAGAQRLHPAFGASSLQPSVAAERLLQPARTGRSAATGCTGHHHHASLGALQRASRRAALHRASRRRAALHRADRATGRSARRLHPRPRVPSRSPSVRKGIGRR